VSTSLVFHDNTSCYCPLTVGSILLRYLGILQKYFMEIIIMYFYKHLSMLFFLSLISFTINSCSFCLCHLVITFWVRFHGFHISTRQSYHTTILLLETKPFIGTQGSDRLGIFYIVVTIGTRFQLLTRLSMTYDIGLL